MRKTEIPKLRWSIVLTVVVLAFGCAIIVVWAASTAFLAILAAIVFAVFLDACARGLGYFVKWPRSLRLVLIFLFAAAVGIAGVYFGGTLILDQIVQFFSASKAALVKLSAVWTKTQIEFPLPDPSEWLPNSATLFGGAAKVATTSFGIGTTALAIFFLGVFFAWEPDTYKAGFLSLLPIGQRSRADIVLNHAAHAMRQWMVGQAISMTVIFGFALVTLILIDMPYAGFLAVQAGLLTFVPTLGPFIAGIVIVLAGLSQSWTMASYGLGVYVLIQLLETHLVGPMVQERIVRLPPGLTLGVQLIAGTLFGLLGLAFAVPLTAAAKVIITELYIESTLGGRWSSPNADREK